MNGEPIELVTVVQTCAACPAQWDAWDATGQYYYLRYRGSIGSVAASTSAAGYAAGDPSTTVATFRHGGQFAGDIGLDEFLQLAGLTLAPDAKVSDYDRHRRNPAPEPMPDRLFVVAGDRAQFDAWCMDHEISNRDRRLVFVGHVDKLRGTPFGVRYIIIGTARGRRDFDHVRDWLAACEAQVWHDPSPIAASW